MTLDRLKRYYAGSAIAKLRRLKLLKEENRKPKQLVADLALNKAMLQEVFANKL
jgi:putative transposase